MRDIEIYTRPDSPVYQAKIKVGDSWKRVSTRMRDKDAAMKAAQEIYIEQNTKYKLGILNDRITIDSIYNQWPKKDKGQNRSTYNLWIKNQWGNKPVAYIQQRELQDYIDGIDRSGSRKEHIIRLFNGVFNTAKSVKVINNVPRLTVDRSDTKPRPTFTPDEMAVILEKLETWSKGGHKWSARDRRQMLWYQVNLMLGSGLRPGGEVDQLKWSDITTFARRGHIAGFQIRVRPETNKMKEGRTVMVNFETGSLINYELKLNSKATKPNDFIFQDRSGRPAYDMHHVWGAFIKTTGLEYNDLGERRVLYSLRHYYITQKLIKGVAPHILAKQTGHSVNMLLRWYSKAISADWSDILIG